MNYFRDHFSILILLITISCLVLMGNINYETPTELPISITEEICSVEAVTINTTDNINKFLIFKEELGFLESSGNYEISKGKYKGKYQFSRIALRDINMEVYYDSLEYNPSIQEFALYNWMHKNNEYLEIFINSFENKKINDILVTRAGILASAHLAGNFHVKRFLVSKGERDFKDQNGTPVSKYLKHFQHEKYQFEFTDRLLIYNKLKYDI